MIPALRALIPQRLIAFDDAVRSTLKEEEKLVNSSDWGYDAQAFARWRPEYGYFAKQAGFTVKTLRQPCCFMAGSEPNRR